MTSTALPLTVGRSHDKHVLVIQVSMFLGAGMIPAGDRWLKFACHPDFLRRLAKAPTC
jgi:hypothetical protein